MPVFFFNVCIVLICWLDYTGTGSYSCTTASSVVRRFQRSTCTSKNTAGACAVRCPHLYAKGLLYAQLNLPSLFSLSGSQPSSSQRAMPMVVDHNFWFGWRSLVRQLCPTFLPHPAVVSPFFQVTLYETIAVSYTTHSCESTTIGREATRGEISLLGCLAI